MVTIATGGVCLHMLHITGGGLNETQRRSRRLGGIPSMGGSLASSAVSNAFLKRQRAPSTRIRGERLVTICTLDAGAKPGEDNRGPFGLGTTRLKRIIQNSSTNFVSRFKRTRKNFPTKIFLLLLGYYSANALATVLGQTGDWDVLAAGILVALIEGVGYLMYRTPSFLGERGRDLAVLVNYYKSGFSFGLFVDAFKLGS